MDTGVSSNSNRKTVEWVLIGESMLTDRGKLLNVGIDYVVIQESDSDDILISIIFIKFVTTYLWFRS